MELIDKKRAMEVSSGFCHWTNVSKEIDKLPTVKAIPEEQIKKMLTRIDAYKKDYILKYGHTSVVFNDVYSIVQEFCNVR